MSRGFVCTLFGLGMNLLAWFGPWAWPAWPAFGAQFLMFGKSGSSFSELPYGARAAVLVLLIVINTAAWALLAAGIAKVLSAIMKRSRQIERPAS